jgi:hypothetical protein
MRKVPESQGSLSKEAVLAVAVAVAAAPYRGDIVIVKALRSRRATTTRHHQKSPA